MGLEIEFHLLASDSVNLTYMKPRVKTLNTETQMSLPAWQCPVCCHPRMYLEEKVTLGTMEASGRRGTLPDPAEHHSFS